MKISYSQANSYKECPKYWFWSYDQKLKSEIEGGSLYFGSAVDKSCMALLEKKPDYIEYFRNEWYAQTKNKEEKLQIFDNPNIIYGHNDFDEDVLKEEDFITLENWAKELNLEIETTTTALYKKVSNIKKNPFKKIKDKELQYFNRASWLSLHRKGEILIEAFKEQFVPKVKQVHATQLFASVKNPDNGDLINGFIDMILTIDGYDKPIIFDLKTSGQAYTQEQIDLTEQLTLYAGFKAKEYNTDLVGYVVLIKNIQKDVQYHCIKCGHKKTSRHKRCDNAIIGNSKERCNGDWIKQKVLKPQIQILIQAKTNEQINNLYNDYENILFATKNKIVFKNTSKCNSWYGSRCVYYNLCHNGDDSGLKKG